MRLLRQRVLVQLLRSRLGRLFRDRSARRQLGSRFWRLRLRGFPVGDRKL